MAHDQERVKTEGGIEDNLSDQYKYKNKDQGVKDLVLGSTDDGGKPSALSGIHEKKDGIVLVDELFELGDLCLCFLERRGVGGDGMTGHGNGKGMTCCILWP